MACLKHAKLPEIIKSLWLRFEMYIPVTTGGLIPGTLETVTMEWMTDDLIGNNSTMVQAMSAYLMAPSQYLNLCWAWSPTTCWSLRHQCISFPFCESRWIICHMSIFCHWIIFRQKWGNRTTFLSQRQIVAQIIRFASVPLGNAAKGRNLGLISSNVLR